MQFDKHGWRNRNRIKSPTGPQWLTVPVRHHGLGQPHICDVEIDTRSHWARKHVGSIKQCYAQAPFLSHYLPELTDMLEHSWNRLVDLDIAVTDLLCRWLGLRRQVMRSSELGVAGERSERLLNTCLSLKASRYLSGDAAKDYLDTELFARHGIEVEWQSYQHPVYPQQHGEFVPYLSVVDLLLNCGDESAAILASRSVVEEQK